MTNLPKKPQIDNPHLLMETLNQLIDYLSEREQEGEIIHLEGFGWLSKEAYEFIKKYKPND